MELCNQLIVNYGYIAIFVLLALGLFSIPIPDEVMVLIVGYFTKTGHLHYFFSFIAVFAGSFIGMLISYYIGKKAGRPLLDKIGKWFGISQKWGRKAERWIEKYGVSAVIISYFIPGMRHIAGYFCGISHMSIKSYSVFAGLSAFVWSLIFLTVGRIF